MPHSPNPLLCTVLALASLLMQCKKSDPSPEDQLPAATQTGANTFGCLLNGVPWQPEGPIILSYWPAYQVHYDSVRYGGELRLTVFRVMEATHSQQLFDMSVWHVQQVGVYPIDGVVAGVEYHNPLIKGACGEFDNAQYGTTGTSARVRGQFTITRLDKRKKIVSGVFDFALSKQGCDTVKVTKGRFDRQYF